MADEHTMNNVRGGATIGAAFGGILGALVGWMIASTPDPVPVIGPVVGQGVIATAVVGLLAGLGIGALTGALLGSFSSAVKEEVMPQAPETAPVLFPISPIPEAELEAEALVLTQEPDVDSAEYGMPAAIEGVVSESSSSQGESVPSIEIESEVSPTDMGSADTVESPSDTPVPAHAPKIRRARRVAARTDSLPTTDE